MSEKRFRTNDLMKFNYSEIGEYVDENHTDRPLRNDELVDLLNDLNDECKFLAKQKDYWKSKAMTLLMQVRRLTPRMTDKEVIEFGKELEDE